MTAILDQSRRIKTRLNACTTPQEIKAVADDERSAVVAMQDTPEGKTQAIQISNLKAYMLVNMGG